jgi:hypothetical protein
MSCYRSAIWALIQEQAEQQTGQIIELTLNSDSLYSSSCRTHAAAIELVSSSCCSSRAGRAAAANASTNSIAILSQMSPMLVQAAQSSHTLTALLQQHGSQTSHNSTISSSSCSAEAVQYRPPLVAVLLPRSLEYVLTVLATLAAG